MKAAYTIAIFTLLISTNSFSQVSPEEAILQMRKGINLGNTHEPPSEAGWNNPKAKESYFDLYKEAGFNTVRIPVRWDNYTSNSAPYKVQDSWLQRIEEVVDWGLERDLWIVINSHHDNWIKDNYAQQAMKDRFDSIWSQIAEHFADKSEKLVFEILNEPHGLTKTQNDEMHARVLSIIRRSNPSRLVIFQGNGWGSADDLINAAIPDPDDPYLIGSFHSYNPWPFGLEGTGSFGSSSDINALRNMFQKVKNWSLERDIPVFLGEFACHKDADFLSRMRHYQTYVELANEFGFCFCVWDDGGNFGLMKRAAGEWREMKDILIYGHPDSPGYPSLNIEDDTVVHLSWFNRKTDATHLLIQRGLSATNYSNIDTLEADAIEYFDMNLDQEGTYYYRVIAQHIDSVDYYSHPVRIYLPEYVPMTRSYFLGSAHQIPGIIEAEDFDNGGEGLSYHDSDERNIPGDYRTDVGVDIYDRLGDGYHIGNMVPGEWMEYSVDVASSDTFRIIVHLASPYSNGSFTINIGQETSGVIYTPSSKSWLYTDTISTLMILEEGEQVLRFTMQETPTFNFDKLEIELYERALDTTSADTSANDTTAVRDFYLKELKAWQGAEGLIQIRFPDEKLPSELRLLDMSGRSHLLLKEAEKVMEIKIPALPSGIYLLFFRFDDFPYTRKVFLQAPN